MNYSLTLWSAVLLSERNVLALLRWQSWKYLWRKCTEAIHCKQWLMAYKSTFVTTTKSGEDFDTLSDNLSALLWHSPTASQQRKFPINWSLPLNQMNMQSYMILLRMSPYFTSKSSKYQWNNAPCQLWLQR